MNYSILWFSLQISGGLRILNNFQLDANVALSRGQGVTDPLGGLQIGAKPSPDIRL